jgi:hypothetical protein
MACVVKRDPEVEKAFWNEAKARLASGVEPEEVIKQIATKYGLGTDAVGSVLTNRQMFQLTNEAWAKQAKVSELRFAAKRAANSADIPPALRVIQTVYEAPRRVLTTGHGGVIPFTHARTSLAIPGEQSIFARTVGRAYSYLTPETGSARWRADMATLRSDPAFNFAARVGLDIKLQSQPVGMGMSRWTRQSFDALKTMRLELFKKYWAQETNKSFENAQDLAKRINHATGSIKLGPKTSQFLGATTFAPKLRASKYASVLDAFTSQFGAKRFAKVAAVNLGLLAINDLVNRYIFQNNDRVNWTIPERADYMRMKIAGMTIPMSPLFETMRLPVAASAVLMNPNEENKAKVLTKEIASAVHPGINALYGAATGTDLATGHPLPFKGVSQYIYGEHRGERKVFGQWRKNKFAQTETKGEYAAGYAPIPFQPVLKEMAKEGIPPDLSAKFLKAYVESVLSGLAGTHAYPNVPYKHYP